jgi:serine/threonine protein kinase
VNAQPGVPGDGVTVAVPCPPADASWLALTDRPKLQDGSVGQLDAIDPIDKARSRTQRFIATLLAREIGALQEETTGTAGPNRRSNRRGAAFQSQTARVSAPLPVIADRYELTERLGAGAMGEVWKALDRRFESRVVAIKILKEDDTLRDDAGKRDQLAADLRRAQLSGPLTTSAVARVLDEVLCKGRGGEPLRARVGERIGASADITIESAVSLYDELVSDPGFSENARLRSRLRRLFRDEANSVANLRHDNIVSISDYGTHEGRPFLAMDYIEGETLQRVIQRRAPVTREQQLAWMEDLAAGLHHAHERHLVHRDVKPANLMIEAATESLKVLDFGVVRRLQQVSESTVGAAVGTLCYMSPEQLTGAASLDRRSDIFSVGAVVYELLTGHLAFPPGESIVDLLHRIQHEPPPEVRQFVPDLQPALERILTKALEKDRDRRYQDLAEMRRDLARVRRQLQTDEELVNRTLLVPGRSPSAHNEVPLTEQAQVAAVEAPPIEPARIDEVATTVRPHPPLDSQPAAVSQDRASRIRNLAAIAVGVVSGVALHLALDQPMRPGPNPPPPRPRPPALVAVTVDVRPWARVRVVSRTSSGQPIQTAATPFVLTLSPGEYVLECENGGLTPPESFPLRVEPGMPQVLSLAMKGFDAESVLTSLFGPLK